MEGWGWIIRGWQKGVLEKRPGRSWVTRRAIYKGGVAKRDWIEEGGKKGKCRERMVSGKLAMARKV